MVQNDTIKSLIPSDIIENVPEEKRAHVAAKIVMFFKENNPELYDRIGEAEELTDVLKVEAVKAVEAAAASAREHHLAMKRKFSGGQDQRNDTAES